jgi:hypothetical protein
MQEKPRFKRCGDYLHKESEQKRGTRLSCLPLLIFPGWLTPEQWFDF